MCEGRAAIYVDFLGYDEVAHHSGPERVDTLAVLRDLDRQIGRIERTTRWTPRPYRIVVLSDHGQTQGATFDAAQPARRWPSSSPGCAARRRRATPTPRRARRSRRRGCARPATTESAPDVAPADEPVVLGSGSLGLISLPGEPRRLTKDEIDAALPRR